MVALLKEDGEFTPMPVVQDEQKFQRLAKSMEEPAKAPAGLVDMLRRVRKEYSVESK